MFNLCRGNYLKKVINEKYLRTGNSNGNAYSAKHMNNLGTENREW